MDSPSENSESRMGQASNTCRPPYRRRSRGSPALQSRFEQALRELPLAEADIPAVARKLAGKLARLRCYRLRNNPDFFDILGKVTAVCAHFAEEGLTLLDYLHAARWQPQLFIKSPATVIANIERVATHFSRYDRMRRHYLQAAMKSPQFFTLNPDTVIANVEAVVQHFAGEGLPLQQYLQAALRRPQLFYRKPATIIGHSNYLIDMHGAGLIAFRGQANAPPKQPLRPLFALVLRRPRYLLQGKRIKIHKSLLAKD